MRWDEPQRVDAKTISAWTNLPEGDPTIKALSSKIIKRACGMEMLAGDMLTSIIANMERGFLTANDSGLFEDLVAHWKKTYEELKK